MATSQPLEAVSGVHTDAWPFTLNDIKISAAQIHAMQGADEESKRYGVYIPAALGLFGLGALLLEDPPAAAAAAAAAAAPTPTSPAPSETRAEDVVVRLRQRDRLIQNAARASILNPNERVRRVGTNGTQEAYGDVVPNTEILAKGHPVSKRSSSGSSSWVSIADVNKCNSRSSGDGSSTEPRVKFSPLLSDEKEKAMAEAVKICSSRGLTTCIPCTRPACGAFLSDVRALAAHIHIHDIEGESTLFRCIGCEARFMDKGEADEHRRRCVWLIRECSSPPPLPTSGGVILKSVSKLLRMTDLWRLG